MLVKISTLVIIRVFFFFILPIKNSILYIVGYTVLIYIYLKKSGPNVSLIPSGYKFQNTKGKIQAPLKSVGVLLLTSSRPGFHAKYMNRFSISEVRFASMIPNSAVSITSQ